MKRDPLIPRETSPWASDLQVSQWFNTREEIDLKRFRGKPVLLYAFQMLCPGCVSHGLPLVKAVYEQIPREEIAVIGLHTVFEHHEAMQPPALEAFLHEYRISFPVGIDRHEAGKSIPLTMREYGMQGTPTLILIDKTGRLRLHSFGPPRELLLGVCLGRLLSEHPEIPEIHDKSV